ncbi:Lipoamide acyltransferase component of branched-chain alpha-keto acid dehydrogenase, partial [Dissostichus eleginoides]
CAMAKGEGGGPKVSLCVDATCQQATVAARHHFSVNMVNEQRASLPNRMSMSTDNSNDIDFS